MKAEAYMWNCRMPLFCVLRVREAWESVIHRRYRSSRCRQEILLAPSRSALRQAVQQWPKLPAVWLHYSSVSGACRFYNFTPLSQFRRPDKVTG